ncbi:DUF7266 family protein [Halalkalicoccus tibetensis]|uniref:Secreted glycoprotein n=1 Tax=Halalkalicoccus tibetensis TaxID=175632 RepID=A0ABD5VAT5_9EURY
MSRSDRGVSTALGYTLTLAITAVLISGLFVTAGSVVDTQRERATAEELTVHGERLAADLMTVDRLSRSGQAVELERDLPTVVGGGSYSIGVAGEPDEDGEATQRIELRSDRLDGPVSVRFTTERDVAVEPGPIAGGTVVIGFDGGAIEVRNG